MQDFNRQEQGIGASPHTTDSIKTFHWEKKHLPLKDDSDRADGLKLHCKKHSKGLLLYKVAKYA